MGTGFGHIARAKDSSRIGPRLENGNFFSDYHPWAKKRRKIGPLLKDGKSFRSCTQHYKRAFHYGVSTEQFDAAMDRQQGLCAVCNESLGDDINIDHDHRTKEFRGILHRRCNAALGGFRDSIESLKRAIVYLGGAL